MVSAKEIARLRGDDGVRARQGVAANRIEHAINPLRNVLKFLFRIINRDIGPELLEQVLVMR